MDAANLIPFLLQLGLARRKKIQRVLFLLWAFTLSPICASENLRMQTITVGETDTLWKIAHRFLKNPLRWPEIVKHNPWLLQQQLILLPGTEVKIPAHLLADHFPNATLVDILKEVLYKSPSQPNWLQAYKNMVLFHQDHLKTIKDSQAQVQFKKGDLLILQEDSVVMLSVEPGKEEVNLLRGSALMQTSQVKIVTPSALITPKKEKTFLKAKVHPDEATTVQVEEGLTEIKSRDTGKTILVKEGFANLTRKNENPGNPIAIPAIPELALSRQIPNKSASTAAKKSLPFTLEAVRKKEEPVLPSLPELAKLEKKEFSQGNDAIHKNPKWKHYKLQISANQNFRPIEREYERAMLPGKTVMEMEEETNLPTGTYFRRVAYRDETGKETDFYDLPPLQLVTQNPQLSLELPEDGLKTREELVSVKGQSLPGLIVTVNGLPVEVRNDGTFVWAVLLSQKGANKIRVEAKDLKGNRSYLERTVYSTR